MVESLKNLHDKINLVCPIVGVSIGDKDRKETWRVDYKNEATNAQRAAAQDILNSYDFLHAQNIDLAKSLLDKSDVVAIRCFKVGVSFPLEWQSHVETLRSIVSTGDGIIPPQPPYPEGA